MWFLLKLIALLVFILNSSDVAHNQIMMCLGIATVPLWVNTTSCHLAVGWMTRSHLMSENESETAIKRGNGYVS